MTCSLCGKRPNKRNCPALRREICAVCCATKRIVEIACPDDCRYLESAQRHPAAVVKRQIDHDVTILMGALGRPSERQLQLFFLLQSIILAHKPEGFGKLADADVALATGALARSLEASSRGVIYEEPSPSIVAEALRKDIRPLLDEVTMSGGSRAEREAAEVLRGIERAARHDGVLAEAGATGYLELVSRVLQQRPHAPSESPTPLIVMP